MRTIQLPPRAIPPDRVTLARLSVRVASPKTGHRVCARMPSVGFR